MEESVLAEKKTVNENHVVNEVLALKSQSGAT